MTIKKMITDKKLSTSYPQPKDNHSTGNLDDVLDLVFGPEQDIAKAKSLLFSMLDRMKAKKETYKLTDAVFNVIDTYLQKRKNRDTDLSNKDKQLLRDLDRAGNRVEIEPPNNGKIEPPNSVKIEPLKDDKVGRLRALLYNNVLEGKILGRFPVKDCIYLLDHWSEFAALPHFLKFTEDGFKTVGKDEEPCFSTAYAIFDGLKEPPERFKEYVDMLNNNIPDNFKGSLSCLMANLDKSRSLSSNSNFSVFEVDNIIDEVFAEEGHPIDIMINWPSGLVSILNTKEIFSYIDLGGITTCLNNIAYNSSRNNNCPFGYFRFMGYRYSDSDTTRYPVSISELCDYGSNKPLSLVFKFIHTQEEK